MRGTRRVALRAAGAPYTVEVLSPDRAAVAGCAETFAVERIGPGSYRVSDGQRGWQAWVAADGGTREVFLEGEAYRLEVRPEGEPRAAPRRPAEDATAPMPATIAQILVRPGQAVRRGEVLLKLEAMKMELLIRAPRDGTVRAVRCREGEVVRAGARLVDVS